MAVLTGMLFGLLPAFRASRLEPVDALRYELRSGEGPDGSGSSADLWPSPSGVAGRYPFFPQRVNAHGTPRRPGRGGPPG